MRMLRVMTPQTSNVWPSETRMSAYSDLKYSKEYGKEARLPPSASSGVYEGPAIKRYKQLVIIAP